MFISSIIKVLGGLSVAFSELLFSLGWAFGGASLPAPTLVTGKGLRAHL